MLELVLLVINYMVLVMIKLVVLDVWEFLCGMILLLEGLLLYWGFGIVLLLVKVLVNCMDYIILVKDVLEVFSNIIVEGFYSSVDIFVSLFDIYIYDLDVYKIGYSLG